MERFVANFWTTTDRRRLEIFTIKSLDIPKLLKFLLFLLKKVFTFFKSKHMTW